MHNGSNNRIKHLLHWCISKRKSHHDIHQKYNLKLNHHDQNKRFNTILTLLFSHKISLSYSIWGQRWRTSNCCHPGREESQGHELPIGSCTCGFCTRRLQPLPQVHLLQLFLEGCTSHLALWETSYRYLAHLHLRRK